MTSESSTSDLINKYGQLTVLDDLILLRAADDVQCPILAYPSPGTDGSSYEYYTGRDLDRMITKALDALVEYGFKPQRKDSYLSRSAPPVVALLTLSDIDMVVTFFALSRLGYTVMMLSPRLSASSCVSLLDTVECDTIFYGQTASIRETMGAIIQLKEVSCRPIHFKSDSLDMHQSTLATLSWYEDTGIDSSLGDVAVILHSSGSTGTPKPLFLTHKALMTHPLRGPGLTSFNSLPWYHLHGLSTAFQAMWMRKTAFMWNASLPVTGERLTKALNGARPESVHAVPYVLQLLVDTEGGIEALKNCKLVTYGGAPCPDELGDKLVRAQVKFGGSFGLTEAGLVAESISRSPQDPYWNYLRFFENIRPYIWMKPLDENTDLVPEQHNSNSLYECVYLSGHPALTASNSDNPPGSFHSRDVFKPHPSIPERWKYITRIDDRITLVNGEKVLPLPIEGLIKQHPLIQDAVVVGVGRATPGLLIFRSDQSTEDNLSESEYLEAIWPAVEEANSRAEKFSQISKDVIAILSSEVALTCPRTDKGSLIRAQVYRQFSDVINSIYAKFDQPGVGTLTLDLEETQEHLMRLCDEELGLTVRSADADLFSAGVDSLKAIHFRRLILRDFHFSDSSKFGQNVVFETATVSRLAENIVALQNGEITNGESGNGIEDELSLMSELISKYSTFRGHLPVVKGETGNKKSTVLTGPTGSICVHTLVELLQDTRVDKVYCLSRRESPLSSILEAMEKKGFTSPELLQRAHRKIVPLKSSLDSPNLGLDNEVFHEMLQKVSVIIHTAWPVNFQLPLRSFEEHIKGLYNLIQFSLDVNKLDPAVVLFCSSISTAMGKTDSTLNSSTSEAEIPDKPMDDLTSALEMGYARSKLVGERIVSLARESVDASAYSLRIGQVSGHSEMGLWNDSEAIPLTIRSALTIRALPELNDICSWLPVDKLAKTIVEIAESKLVGLLNNKPNPDPTVTPARVIQYGEEAEKDQHSQYDTNTNTPNDTDDTVYNICNPNTFTWSQLLAALHQTGFTFTTVPFEKWLTLLRESEEKGEEHVNPAIKLIGFYDDMHSGRGDARSRRFRTDRAERDSETLRGGGFDVIGSGILGRYARDWLERWV